MVEDEYVIEVECGRQIQYLSFLTEQSCPCLTKRTSLVEWPCEPELMELVELDVDLNRQRELSMAAMRMCTQRGEGSTQHRHGGDEKRKQSFNNIISNTAMWGHVTRR